jgi:hypothetical protein
MQRADKEIIPLDDLDHVDWGHSGAAVGAGVGDVADPGGEAVHSEAMSAGKGAAGSLVIVGLLQANGARRRHFFERLGFFDFLRLSVLGSLAFRFFG